jgi:hypothetical protein
MGSLSGEGWRSGTRPIKGESAHGSGIATSCSFCGKDRPAVRGLVASGSQAGVAICDECVDLCAEIFDEQRSS